MIENITKHSILGILILSISFMGMGVNDPIYKILLEKVKKRYAFEMVQLAKEIFNY